MDADSILVPPHVASPTGDSLRHTRPTPDGAGSPAEFVRELRRLKAWAGDPSLVDLQRRTGVPRSTLCDALSLRRETLPPLHLVHRFVRACGVNADEAELWQRVWRHLRSSEVPPPSAKGTVDRPVPHYLPLPPAGLVPRPAESDALDSWLANDDNGVDATVAVLSGGPGVGKTALALLWGHRHADSFPDGQLYLDLHGNAETSALDPATAITMLLRQLRVDDLDIPTELGDRAGLYRSIVYGRHLLVLLDNAMDVEQVRPLLPAAPTCRTVITSRNRCTGLAAREGARRLTMSALTARQSVKLLSMMLGADRVREEVGVAEALAEQCACKYSEVL